MKFKAIIAEYNPFHNGHKYQIEKIKGANDLIIVIMSSSFTQRGKPAILDKYTRARLAINNGADIVLELPTIFSSSSAEIFSRGAIGILENLKVVDQLCFGSEDDLEDLLKIQEKISQNQKNSLKNLKFYLAQGFSFLQARELSYKFLSPEEISILKKPNNILAFEYLKALERLNSKIEPFSIKRHKVDHNSQVASENFASSSYIRKKLKDPNCKDLGRFLPTDSYNALTNNKKVYLNDFFVIFKYLLLSKSINFSSYIDYENGLENRFFKYIDSKNIDEFIDKVSSKRYTKARISRLICHIILDIKRNFVFDAIDQAYIRILASNKNGFELLKLLKEKDIFYIDKFSKINNLDKHSMVKKIALKESAITNIYNIFSSDSFNSDYLKNFIVKK